MKKVKIGLSIIVVVIISIAFTFLFQQKKEDSTLPENIAVKTPDELDYSYRNYADYLDSASQGEAISGYQQKSVKEQLAIKNQIFRSQMLLMALEDTSKKEIKIVMDNNKQLMKGTSNTNYTFDITNINDNGDETPILVIDTEQDSDNYLFAWYELSSTQSFNLDEFSFQLYSDETGLTYKPDAALSSFLFPLSDSNQDKHAGLIVYPVPKAVNDGSLKEIVTYSDKTMEGQYTDEKNYTSIN